ncbi:MAG: carnitine dehydratase [Symbiobacteriaceae bacterium]|jgi:crotonobetainyl-CoA:carnitine CoA-transferase CaiB-like acyl-CoA transferase|nr:carnitine dehydratase [Symbiobacteriaceae bacterium]
MKGPLVGVTVLDLTRLLPGPYCAWLLRNWGARVIKVEDVQAGDYLREAQPVWFAHLNAGAESLALDLKHPGGRELFLRLLPETDVVLEGFRPGVLERLQLGFDEMSVVNPRLVLTSISGYASDSGLAERAGHDLNYLARSGLLSLMGEAPPVQIADLAGGLTAAAATLAAVVGARASGLGSHVEASLFDSVAGFGAVLRAEARAGLAPTRATMPLAGALPCYGLYGTADGGRVTLGALEPKFWVRFCQAVGRADWVERQMDPALRGELAALFAGRDLAAWAALGERADCCLEPVLSLAEAVGGAPHTDQPVRFDGRRPEAQGPAPGQGAQTREILQSIGISEQDILSLSAEGVIRLGR